MDSVADLLSRLAEIADSERSRERTAAEAIDDELRDRCQSLIEFAEVFWPILEPGRKLLRGWAIEAIAEHLEAVARGQIKQLLINVPPGMSKSMLTSVLLTPFEWGPLGMPWHRHLCFSYVERLTIRDNLRARRVVRSELYQRLWPTKLTGDQNAKTKFENTRTGWKIASSVGGVGTGERGDRLIVDDPHSVDGAESDATRESALYWFTETLPTRTNDPKTSAIVIIMQRVHEQDISGHVLKHELGYDHLCLPMHFERAHPTLSCTSLGFVDPRKTDGELLFPERFAEEDVEQLSRVMRSKGGDYAVAGQLQQRPTPRKGGLFHGEDFKVLESMALCESVLLRVRGWDFAGTADNPTGAWTSGVLMALVILGGLQAVVIEDVVREQVDSRDLPALIVRTARQDGGGVEVNIPQDPGQAGKHQVGHLASLLMGYVVIHSPESGSKETRAAPLASMGSSGNLYLLGSGAWQQAFVAEAVRFPGGLKDQVDAASRAYARIVEAAGYATGGIGGPSLVKRANED